MLELSGISVLPPSFLKRGLGGVIFLIDVARRFIGDLCHPERSEGSLNFTISLRKGFLGSDVMPEADPPLADTRARNDNDIYYTRFYDDAKALKKPSL